MAAAYPSASNVFIRSHEASGKMVIDFARNAKDFAVNRYVQIHPVKKVAGLYLHMTIEEAGRIVDAELNNFAWADGQVAPEGNDGLEAFEFLPFQCTRRAFPFLLGDLTIDQADWSILEQHASIKSRQAMTARTQLAISALTTAGNYDATHVLDVTAISGNSGNWAQSTTARQDIKRSLYTAMEKILDDTLAAVAQDQMRLIISSGLAMQIAQSQEIVDYIKGSPDALAQVKGELAGRNTMYDLPDRLYGFELEVEATRKVTSKKGATTVKTPILATQYAILCSRPGGLEGVAGAPSFSTCVLFAQEEMTVETLKDANNRRTMGRVVETLDCRLVAPSSGILFTACA